MPVWDIGVVAQERVDSVAALAAEAEALGFGGIWVADSQHVFRDPWAALALAAARTHRIRLATGVTNPVTRAPAVTACAVATLDELSGGRAVLGIGVGESAVHNLGLRRAFEAGHIDPLPFMQGAIARGLDALEAIACTTAGRYLVRDGVTLADMYLIPQLYNARRFHVELGPYPTLLRVEGECTALGEFQSAHPNAQPDYDPNA